MSRELLASQKNHSGIVLDPRTKLAVLTTIAVFILGGSYEGVMQYYIIVLAAIPLLLLLSAGKWKGAVLYLLIFGGSLCLELFGLSYLTGVANFIAVAIVGLFLRFTPGIVMGYFVVTTTTVSEFVAAIIVTAYFNGMFEVVRHNMDRAAAHRYVKMLNRYHMAGFSTVFDPQP